MNIQDDYFLRGIYLTKMTDPSAIQDLIRRLRPRKTEFDLVRVGPQFDGGYLIPDHLGGIKTCFSPGVGDSSAFELSLKTRFGVESHLADFSVDGPQNGFIAKSFTKKNVGANDRHDTITLDTWFTSLEDPNTPEEYLLQMDIEGDEYRTIVATSPDILSKFRIIVLEIHHVASWAEPYFFRIVEAFFEKLLCHHTVVHVHPNNYEQLVSFSKTVQAPRCFEITLLRTNRVSGEFAELPHSLDSRCYFFEEELLLPPNWLT